MQKVLRKEKPAAAKEHHASDLRTALDWLREQGDLIETDKPVDPDLEVTGLQKHLDGGCPRCSKSGYLGRMGIYELLVTGESIRDMCVQRLNASAIRNQALKEGMITLRQDGWRKVQEGLTTLDEVARVTKGDAQ